MKKFIRYLNPIVSPTIQSTFPIVHCSIKLPLTCVFPHPRNISSSKYKIIARINCQAQVLIPKFPKPYLPLSFLGTRAKINIVLMKVSHHIKSLVPVPYFGLVILEHRSCYGLLQWCSFFCSDTDRSLHKANCKAFRCHRILINIILSPHRLVEDDGEDDQSVTHERYEHHQHDTENL